MGRYRAGVSVPGKTTAAGRLARLGSADPGQAQRLLAGDLALDPEGAGAEVAEALAAVAIPTWRWQTWHGCRGSRT